MNYVYDNYLKIKNPSYVKKLNASTQKFHNSNIDPNNFNFMSIYGSPEISINQPVYQTQTFDVYPTNNSNYIFNNYYYNNYYINQNEPFSKSISPIRKQKKIESFPNTNLFNDNKKIKNPVHNSKVLLGNNYIIDKDYKDYNANEDYNMNDNKYLTKSSDIIYNNNTYNRNLKKKNLKQFVEENNRYNSVNTDSFNNGFFLYEYFNDEGLYNYNNNNSNNNFININTINYNTMNNNNIFDNNSFNSINNDYFNNFNYTNNNYNKKNNFNKKNNTIKKMNSNIEKYPYSYISITDLPQNFNENYNCNNTQSNIQKNIRDFSQLNNKTRLKSESKKQINIKQNPNESDFYYRPKIDQNYCKLENYKKNSGSKINREKFLEKTNNITPMKLYNDKSKSKSIDNSNNNKSQQLSVNKKNLNYMKNKILINKNLKQKEKENIILPKEFKEKDKSQICLTENGNIKNNRNKKISSIIKKVNKNIINHSQNDINNNISRNYKILLSNNINNKNTNNKTPLKNYNNSSLSNVTKINKLIPNYKKIDSNLNENNKNNTKILNNRMKNRIQIIVGEQQKLYSRINRKKKLNINFVSKMTKKECEICHILIASHLYRIHYNSHPSQIFNWLYLGSFANACDIKELKSNGINNILNCASECHNNKLPKDIQEIHLKIKDVDNFNISDYFEEANEYINRCKLESHKLLVHCKLGISRSTSLIIAYLVKYDKFTVNDALNFVKNKRNQIKPNKGFMNQLYEYEKKCKNEKRK